MSKSIDHSIQLFVVQLLLSEFVSSVRAVFHEQCILYYTKINFSALLRKEGTLVDVDDLKLIIKSDRLKKQFIEYTIKYCKILSVWVSSVLFSSN